MLKIRDLDCKPSYLESLNDVKAENLVGGGSTVILLTTGTLLISDDTGAKVEASNVSFGSISVDAAGNKTVKGGTLLQGKVTRPNPR
ncbi:hypothetical protein [uncultured Nostoc sp.]|uniref:hypothetical protein n=1 Tax=uncultured Nostoc sp. TaxID=340711 RepID=UPI0035C965A8